MYNCTPIRLLVLSVLTVFMSMLPLFIFSQPSSIGDYVWYDANNNGRQDIGEPAYENTRVWLYTQFGTGAFTLVGQTVTDASGNYSFTSVNAFLQANRTYYIVVVDDLQEPGTINPTTLTLSNIGSDDLDSDATFAPASFTAFAGLPYIEINSGGGTGALTSFDFGFYTLCSDLTVTLPSSIEACFGETLDLIAITSGGNGQLGFDWTDGSSGLSNTNSVRVFSSQTYGVTVTDEVGCEKTAEVNINVTNCPMDLRLEKSHIGANAYLAGDDVTFDITICNEGEAVVDSVVIFDYLPSGYILMDPDWTAIAANSTFTTAAIEISSSTGHFPATGLQVGTCVTIPIDVQIDICAGTDNLENTALIQYQIDAYGQVTDSDSTPNATIADEDDTDTDSAQVFDLALRKTVAAPSFPYKMNEPVTFNIEIFNQGNVPATSVQIIDHIPAGLVFTSGPNTGWNYNTGTSQAILTMPGTILPGQSAIATITLLVGPGTTVDDWTNNAEILSANDDSGNNMTNFDFDSTPDANPTNDIGGIAGTDSDNEINDNGQNKDGDNVTDEDDQDTEMIQIFDLALIKELTTSAPYFYGQDHQYNITICNQGNIVATDIVVTDYIPNGYEMNPASMPLWTISAGGNLVTSTMGQLAPGTCDMIPLTLTFNQTTGDTDDWINYAEIVSAKDNQGVDMTANDMDSTPGSNSLQENSILPDDVDDNNLNGNGPVVGEDEDDHDPAGPKVYDVALSKTLAATGPFEYGDVLTYSINVTNQGNEILSGVDVYDLVPSGLTYLPANNGLWAYMPSTRVAFTTINNLTPGQTQTITIQLEVNASVGDIDAWTNYAEVANIRDENGTNVNALEADSTPNLVSTDDIGGTPDSDEDDEINDSGTDYDGDGVTDEDDHDPERIEIFDLALKKETFTPGPYLYYQDVTFIITVENQGNTPATDVVIEDYIPSGYILNTALSTGWTSAGRYTITGPILPGESVEVPIVLITQPSVGIDKAWINYAEIISAKDDLGVDRTNQDADSTPESNTTSENSVIPQGLDDNNTLGNGPSVGEDEDDHDPAGIEIFDLSLVKTTTANGPFKINDVVTFDIEICNQGNVNPNTITVLDYLADGFVFSANNVPTWVTIAVPNAASTTINGLAPNTCIVRSIDLRLTKAYNDPNAWTNIAEISSALDASNVLLTDADSQMDNDISNDVGGTPYSLEDDHVLDNGLDTNGDGITDEDDSDPTRLRIFDLALDKKLITQGPYLYGQLIQFDITVYNQGNEVATAVMIEDYFASGYIFNVADNTGWNASAQYQIPSVLAPNTSVTVPVFLRLEQTTGSEEDWYNYAEIISFSDENGVDVSGSDFDSTPASNSTTENTVIPSGANDDNILGCGPITGEDEDDHDPAGIRFIDAALRKTLLTTGTVRYGDIVTFQIEVFNQGSEEFDVEIVDYIPEGLVYVGSNDPTWSLDAATDYAYTSLSNIDPGFSKTVTIDLQLQSFCNDSTAWTNRAEISKIFDVNGVDVSILDYDSDADALNGNDVGGTVRSAEDDLITDDGTDRDGDGVADEDDEDPAIVDIFDLALKKVLTSAGALVNGQDFGFNIIVENQGNLAATNVVIGDYVPAGFFFDINKNPGWTAGVTYNIAGPLYPEGIISIPIVLTYVQTTGGMIDYTNYAEIQSAQDIDGVDMTGNDIDSTPGSDTAAERSVQPLELDDNNVKGNGPLAGEDEDDHDPAGLQIYDVALRKTIITPAPYEKGEIVTFQIEVFNQGAEELHNVTVTDYYAMGIQFIAGNNPIWTPDATNGWATTTIPVIAIGGSEIVTIDYLLVTNTDQTGWTNVAEVSQMFNDAGIDVTLLDIDSTPDQVKGNDIGGTPRTGEDDEIDDDGTDFNQDGIADEDDSDPALLPVYDAALTKEVVTLPPYSYQQLIQFDITVYNQGNSDLSQITVADYLPIGFSFDVANNPGWTAAATYEIPGVLASWSSVTFPIYLTIEQTTGGTRDWLNYAEVISFADGNGVDQTANDYDSNLASNSAYELLVEEGDLFDNNIFGCGAIENEDEDDHDPAGIQIFDLALNKRLINQNGPYKCDRILTFEIEVFNQGNETVQQIEIIDYLPAGLAYQAVNNGIWTLDATGTFATLLINSIDPGQSVIIPITLQVVESTDLGDNWYNNAEIVRFEDTDGIDRSAEDIDSTPDNINGNDIGGTADSAEDDHVADDSVDGNGDGITDEDDQDPERISVYDLALIKEVVTQPIYEYYDIIDFNITVCNQGNEVLNNITIEDYVPIGFGYDASINTGWNTNREYTITTPLAPDACTVIPLKLQILQTTGGSKDWANYAEITRFEDMNGVDRSLEDFDSTPGSNSAYENLVREDDAYNNELEGNGQAKGEDEDDHDVAEIEIYDLALNKRLTDQDGPYLCDRILTFEIEVFNQGNKSVTDVDIYDFLPEGLEFMSANEPLWNYNPVSNNAFATIPAIGPGLSEIITIQLRVVESTAVGDNWYNHAEISEFSDMDGVERSSEDIDSTPDTIVGNDIGGTADSAEDDHVADDGVDGNGDGITDEDDQDPERISVYDLALIKEVVTQPIYEYYDIIDFNITVCNQGNEVVNNITIEDYVPIGFGYDASINTGWNANREYTITTPLAPDACTVIPLKLEILQTTGGSKNWANYAEITRFEDMNGVDRSLEDFDSTPGSNSAYENLVREEDAYNNELEGNGQAKGEDEDDHDVAEIEIYDLALNKRLTDQDGPYLCDRILTFEIEVFNQGNETVQQIEFIDYLPAGLAYQAVNNGIWTLDATGTFATSLINSIDPGQSVIIPITLQVVESTDLGDNWYNYAEIVSFEDTDGMDRSADDIDSTPDTIVGNDIGGTADSAEDDHVADDGVDGNGDGITDEDDQDPERISVYDLALIKEVVTQPIYEYYDIIDFNITVCNQGNEVVNNITIEDYVPIGFGFDASINTGWNADREYTITTPLAPDACTIVPIKLEILQTTGGSKDWANYAEITRFEDMNGVDRSLEDFDSTPGSNSAYENLVREADAYNNELEGNGQAKGEDEDDHDVAEIIVQDLAIKKEIITQGPYIFGQPVTYRMTIYNQGNDPAYSTTLSDYLPVGLSYNTASNASWSYDTNTNIATTTFANVLQPGDSRTVDIVLNINKLKDDEDAWDNRVEISSALDQFAIAFDDIDSELDAILGNDVGGTPWTIEDDHVADDKVDGNMDGITDEDDEDVARITIFDLALRKVLDTPTPHVYNQVLDFTITVFNQGNEEASLIEILDYVPAGFVFDASINPGWVQLGNGDLEYSFPGTLAPLASVSVPLSLEIIRTDGGVKHWTNYAEIKTASGRTDLGSPNRDLWDVDSTPNSDSQYENNVCLPPYNSPDDLLNPWDDEICGCGPVYGEDEDDHDPAGIEIFDLAQTKTTTATTPFRYGDMIAFTVTIYNQGSLNATDIEITDYLPCGFEFVPAANTGWTQSGNILTRTTTGTLLPGASTQITLNLRVIPCISDSEIAWTNYTEISDAETEDLFIAFDFDSTSDQVNEETNIADNEVQTASDEDDHDVERIEVMDFALRKTTPICDPLLLGDTIRFDITVYNQGNVMNGNIGIIDTIHSGFIYDTSLNPGWIINGNIADYTIAANAIAPEDSLTVPLFLIITMDSDPFLEDYWNRAEISYSSDVTGNIIIDADSNADRNFYNDNNVLPNDASVVNIFDPNDDEITDNFPVYGNVSLGNDDEDDSDPAKINVLSRLADYVWKDIDGNGLQDVNEPGVQNVEVYLKDCDDNIVDFYLTDEDGFYEFVDILPGFYYVDFDFDLLPRGCAFTFPDVGLDDTIDSDVDLDGLIPCRPIAGMQDSTLDAGLLILANIGDFVWEDLDGDGIQDLNEPGISGVTVNLIDVNGDILGITTTDATGYWIIEDIYPGFYYLQFITPAGYEVTFSNQGVNDAKDSDVDGSNGLNTTPYTFLASGEDDFDWDAGLYRCVKIGEVVWYDINEDDIRAETENGINGITMVLYRLDPDGVFRVFDSQLTGNKPGSPSVDGYYKFCTNPGTYYVEAILPPYGLVPAVANVGNDDTIDSDATNAFGLGTTNSFTLSSGQELCSLGHGYYPMAEVGDRAWKDANHNGTQDTGEEPLAGVMVEAYNAEGVMVGSDITAADGTYNIDYLGKDGYYMKFTPPAGFAPTQGNMGNDDAMDSDIDNSQGYLTTDMYYLEPGMKIPNVDAGFVAGVLPLDWISFTVERVKNYHEVNWVTTNEINTSHFILERSLDAVNAFVELTKVEAASPTMDVNEYTYMDFDVQVSGDYYYRLKQLDVDGNFAYSDIIRLSVLPTRSTEILLSPNPAINEVFLDFAIDIDGEITADILDANGKLVRKNAINTSLKAGTHNLGMDIQNLVSGVYTVQITMNEETINKRLIVMKN